MLNDRSFFSHCLLVFRTMGLILWRSTEVTSEVSSISVFFKYYYDQIFNLFDVLVYGSDYECSNYPRFGQ